MGIKKASHAGETLQFHPLLMSAIITFTIRSLSIGFFKKKTPQLEPWPLLVVAECISVYDIPSKMSRRASKGYRQSEVFQHVENPVRRRKHGEDTRYIEYWEGGEGGFGLG